MERKYNSRAIQKIGYIVATFVDQLKSSKPTQTKSKSRDQIKNIYRFDVNGISVMVELTKMIHWGFYNQFRNINVVGDASIFVECMCEDDTVAYKYIDRIEMDRLGLSENSLNVVHSQINNMMSKFDLSASDIKHATKKKESNGGKFNITSIGFVQVS